MREARIRFCALNAERNKNGKRPVVQIPLQDLGITYEQAKQICSELQECKTIVAWLLGSENGEGTNNI